MKKRILAVLLTAALASALAACGSSSEGTTDTQAQVTETEAAAETTTENESTESAAEPTAAETTAAETTAPSTTTAAPEEAKDDGGGKKSQGSIDPADVTVNFTASHENGKEAGHFTATAGGKEIWSIDTAAYPVSQLDCVSALSKNGSHYYYVEKGSVVCVDVTTGKELWRNSDFGGSPAQHAFTFGNNGALYLCGYLGPDLFVCSSDGATIKLVGSFNDDYYWPYEITCDDNAKIVTITYEMSPVGDGGTLSVSTTDYSVKGQNGSQYGYEDGDDFEPADEDNPYYYAKVKEYLSLRTAPSTDAPVKAKLAPNTAMDVLGYTKGMAKVRVLDTGEIGYVNPDYITSDVPSSGSSSSGISVGSTVYANVNEYLTLREGPSTSSAAIDRLPDWTEMTVLEAPQGKMVKVRVVETGQVGYVHTDFLAY